MIYFVISGHLTVSIELEGYGFVLEDDDVDFKNQFSMMEKIILKTEIFMRKIDDANIMIWILSTFYPKSLCGLVG